MIGTLNHGNYGIFLIMGSILLCSVNSFVGFKESGFGLGCHTAMLLVAVRTRENSSMVASDCV